MIKGIKRILSLAVFSIISICASAQNGTYSGYSPYSIFGVGNICKDGTTFNKSMGGVGIATRNKRFINTVNPAAVTARDSLSFMGDFGLIQNNTIYSQGEIRSAHNTFNISDFVLSFPIYKSSAFMVGITPYSDMGYDFSHVITDKTIIGDTGNITYDSYGIGSVYQLFAGAGVTLWKKLSLGAEMIFLFGNLDKVTNMNFADVSYRTLNSGNKLIVRGLTGKFGLQYEQKLGSNVSMTVGATYRMGSNVRGYATDYRFATQSSVVDTLGYTVDTLKKTGLQFADEIGVGISLKGGDKWSVEFDYIRSDWRKTGMDSAVGFASVGKSVFSTTVSNSYRAGFEIVPNRNDVRYYFRRCAYRAGVYYDQAYYKLDGNNINSIGVTLGLTLPVYKWYNGISLGVDLGQRASTRNNMIRERYVTFNVGFNIHDIWFQKPRYN